MRSKLIFILAIVFGLITSVFIYKYLSDAKQALDNTEYVKIVVAKQDIPAKTKIKQNMLALKQIPEKYMHEKETTNLEDVINKILLVPVTTGESIMSNQVLGPNDSKEGLAYIVPVGKRALTVPVDEVSGVAGLIKPGDSVDVISTVVIADKPYTVVPLQDIEVLAVDKEMDIKIDGTKKPTENSTVTLAVTYAQAKPLMMASQRGVIRLMLRSPIDNTRAYSEAYTLQKLLKEKESNGGVPTGKNTNPNSK